MAIIPPTEVLEIDFHPFINVIILPYHHNIYTYTIIGLQYYNKYSNLLSLVPIKQEFMGHVDEFLLLLLFPSLHILRLLPLIYLQLR